ncbi:MAG: hypothetical protein AABM41_00860 [Chloroflexota bacterium]
MPRARGMHGRDRVAHAGQLGLRIGPHPESGGDVQPIRDAGR